MRKIDISVSVSHLGQVLNLLREFGFMKASVLRLAQHFSRYFTCQGAEVSAKTLDARFYKPAPGALREVRDLFLGVARVPIQERD